MTASPLPFETRAHVFAIAPDGIGELPPGVTSSTLPRDPAAAAAAVATVLADARVDVLVFWDARCGALPWSAVARFERSRDDVWHPGARATGADAPDLLRYVLPQWVYRPDPSPTLDGAINWKLTFRAAFIRARAVRAIGGLDGGFATLAGVALDLGLRLLLRGAICRQHPALVDHALVPEPSSLADRYRLLGRHYGGKWLGYTLARRLLGGSPAMPEVRAWRAGRSARSAIATPAVGALHRALADVEVPMRASVSVVLPTFGRYRYVAEVLEDLRAQTIRPTQIIIADGNAPEDREPEVYARFADLPIEVIWHDEPGTCSGRNACLQRTTGDYVWFVDDDSRFAADNLEAHLRVMVGYGADVSVGPAYTGSRPALHGNQREVVCTFMDCGTTVCTRAILEAVGGFDMRYNRWLVGEDGELGIRFVRAGGVMVNNPLAQRFHYMAPVGGSRQKISVHRFTRWSWLPRPAQSIYYTSRRYYEPGTVWDAVGQACALYGWRRKEGQPATPRWRASTLVGELVALPLTAARLWRSVRLGRAMVAAGPDIPPIAARDQRGRITAR